ncbi:MAG: BMP family ABC transporter substrate-binding protein [Halobacteriales archaeon SW_9_67_25]|nr:MAG: BMP family ABC transporter substrate-binding protein [Halobacteriales archaeon SW_9_67_25]
MTRNISRRDAIRAIGATGLIGLAGCGGDGGDGSDGGSDGSDGGGDGGSSDGSDGDDGGSTDGEDGGMDTVRAAWVYNSEVGDLGWSWAHNEGRKATAEEFDWIETDYTEAVAPEDSERIFRQYASDDYDIVFGCTFGYQDPMVSVAEDNPDVFFEHNTGYATRENMGRYMGRIYQARYMAGVAAGMITEANSLGYVAAFPIAEVVRGINAFTLGAASVNEDVTTKVRWTNTWFDPPSEQEAANSLIDEGVDVMAQHQDSPAAVRAANEAGIWSTGYDAPMGEFGGDKYITSPIWNWEEFYIPTVEDVREGTWESDAYWEGLNAGIVDLSEWGPNVPEDVTSEVSDVRSQIESGDLDVWAGSAFEGESDEFLFQDMASYVEQVEGEVPS